MGKSLIRAVKALSQSVFALSSSNERVRGSNFPPCLRVKSVLGVSEDGFAFFPSLLDFSIHSLNKAFRGTAGKIRSSGPERRGERFFVSIKKNPGWESRQSP